MATNPDPTLELVTSKGVSRTLDDWSTMFQLCLVILPDRPEASAWIPVARRIFDVLGDSDCRTAYVVPSTAAIAQRILGDEEQKQATFVDPDRTLVKSLGLERSPRSSSSARTRRSVPRPRAGIPAEWQRVAKEVAKAMAWSVPEVAPPGEPIPTPSGGWKV